MAGESIVRSRWKILGNQVPSGALCVIMGIQFQSAVDPWVGAYISFPTGHKKGDDVCYSIMTKGAKCKLKGWRLMIPPEQRTRIITMELKYLGMLKMKGIERIQWF